MSEPLEPQPQTAESARAQLLDIIEDGWWDYEAFAIERSGVEQVLARLESALGLEKVIVGTLRIRYQEPRDAPYDTARSDLMFGVPYTYSTDGLLVTVDWVALAALSATETPG